MKRALVIGSGITGLTSARLLTCRGWEVHLLASPSQASPTLLLNHVTCSLFQDIWRLEDSFWNCFHLLHQRQVCWGESNTMMSMSQPDTVIKGNQLAEFFLQRLLQESQELISVDRSSTYLEQLNDPDGLRQLAQYFPWIIDASGRAAAIAQQLGSGVPQSFGHRCAITQEVTLAKNCEDKTYWIETVANAWVFLAPLGDRRALLQVMVPSLLAESVRILPHILEQTLTIKHQISNLVGSSAVFSAFPQILASLNGQVGLSGSTWMAVGDAAFCVDPISGDGTGYAIRGAILATSIINSIACSLVDHNNGLHHYTLRLRQAFVAHLKACISYYSVGFSSLSWQAEIHLMQKAFANNKLSQSESQELKHGLQEWKLVEFSTPIG
jgi:flavin-dependent dehydrogenase